MRTAFDNPLTKQYRLTPNAGASSRPAPCERRPASHSKEGLFLLRATEAKATQAVTSHGATQAGNECQRPHRPRSHEGAEPHRQATKAEATQAQVCTPTYGEHAIMRL